jgi:DNA-binding transcriptional LysR family regulator
MDPLEGIAAFACVAENGSFTAAARRLKISKSAVSAHVQRLESRLGVLLLNRTTRRLSLTEAGAAYHRHCARILSEADAAEQAAAACSVSPAAHCESPRLTASVGCTSLQPSRLS